MKHLLSILLLSIILAACSSDPIAPPATDGTPIKLSLRIATQSKDAQSKDAQSKASALPTLGWNYEQGDELIEDWVVIMVNDADHTIEQVTITAGAVKDGAEPVILRDPNHHRSHKDSDAPAS